MKQFLPLVLLIVSPASRAQFYDQNFDGTSAFPLPFAIDTAAGTLWQVGPPQKALFNSAYSAPNVMVTDTLATYTMGNSSSFTVKADLSGFWPWNVFFLRFYHAFDTDSLMDGGYLEVSWNNGATWTNMFEDWMMPLNIENHFLDPWEPFLVDTLANGQIGYSGRSGGVTSGLRWAYSSFCWETMGFPLGDSLFVRFTFASDSLAEYRDGWMIDDIVLEAYITHPVSEYTRMDDYFLAVPNPVTDRLMLVYDIDTDNTAVDLALYDQQGRRLRVVREGTMPRTVDHLMLQRAELPAASGLYFIRGTVGGRRVEEKIVLAEKQ